MHGDCHTGVHNVENYLAATAAVIEFVDKDVIRRVATTFRVWNTELSW